MPGLSTLLPPSVAVVEWRPGQPPVRGEIGLYPREQLAVAQAVPERRREFALGRSCARQGLRQLGLPVAAIPQGPAGEPVWPNEVVGTITHCACYAAAAVATRGQVLSLGIDAEPNQPLPYGVLELTASPDESARLHTLAAAHPGVRWGRLSFCAKEAVYKAWYPLHRRWLGFEDVAVRILPNGQFRAALLAQPLADERFSDLAGRWVVDRGVLLAAVALPAGGS